MSEYTINKISFCIFFINSSLNKSFVKQDDQIKKVLFRQYLPYGIQKLKHNVANCLKENKVDVIYTY